MEELEIEWLKGQREHDAFTVTPPRATCHPAQCDEVRDAVDDAGRRGRDGGRHRRGVKAKVAILVCKIHKYLCILV